MTMQRSLSTSHVFLPLQCAGVKILKETHLTMQGGVYIAHTIEEPHAAIRPAVPSIWMSMAFEDAEIYRNINGQEEVGRLRAYSISLAPSVMPVQCRIGQKIQALHIFLDYKFFQSALNKYLMSSGRFFSLRPVFGDFNSSTVSLLVAIKDALYDGGILSQTKLEFMASALCVDLYSKYASDYAVYFEEKNTKFTEIQINNINNYIINNLLSDISIEDLSRICSMNVATFHRNFKKTFKETPYQYIIRERIIQSVNLIANSSLSLSSIAQQCGFADHAHFSTRFRQVVGVTPSNYRRLINM